MDEPTSWTRTVSCYVFASTFLNTVQLRQRRDRDTGKGVRDRHFRFDIDLFITPPVIESLRRWKNILELRFDQTEIYMRLSERVIWL
jgi:hypothetical protein